MPASFNGRLRVLGAIGPALLLATLANCSSSNSPAAPTITVSSIAVTGSAGTGVVGQTASLVATASYSDGSVANVTSQATWDSSNTVVATVAPTGVVTFIAAGAVDVRATFKSVTGVIHVTVNPPAPTLTSIAVTGISAGTIGGTGTLTATATYSNGTTANVTTQVAWSSSNTGIATVNATGVVTFVGSGDVDLRATLSGITGSLRIGVSAAQVFRNIDGTVKDSVSNQAIADVFVQVRGGANDGRSARTNSNGDYTLSSLATGSFTLEFSGGGLYSTTSRDLTLSDDTRIDVTMTPNVSSLYGSYNITLTETKQTCTPPPAAFGTQSGTLELAGQQNGTSLTVKITERGVSRTYTGGRMSVDGSFGGGLPAGTLFPGALRPLHEVSSSMKGKVTGSSISGTEDMTYTSGCQVGAMISLSFNGGK